MAGKPRKNPVTDEQICEAYSRLRSAYKVADALGISDKTVYRVLEMSGVVCTGQDDWRKSITLFVGQEDAIRSWYEDGATLQAIKDRLGNPSASDYAVKHAIRRAGGVMRPNPAPTAKDGEVEKICELHASGLGQQAISLAIGRSQSFVSRAMRRSGISTHKSHGSSHSNWKGGRFLTGNGYVRAYVDKSDPMFVMANNTGHVLEHRLVMARYLGRPLSSFETVHHIDGDRKNNALENLQLHVTRHGSGQAFVCLDCGSPRIGPAPIGVRIH